MQASNNRNGLLHLLTTFLFLALFAFPVLPLKVTNVLLMALAAFSLLCLLLKPVPVGRLLLMNLVFVIPFIPYLVEFCYSGFDPVARFEFEKKLLFFTAPVIIPIFVRVTGFREYKTAFYVFAVSVTALTAYSLLALIIRGVPFSAESYVNGAFTLRDQFEKISGLHPTYYSIFALFSASIFAYYSPSFKSDRRMNHLLASAALFLMVIFLAVRIAIITGAVLFIIWIFRSAMNMQKKFTVGLLIGATLIILSFSVTSLRNRFSEFGTLASRQTVERNTVSQRVVIFGCTMQVLRNNIWVGTGSRYSQKELNDCYSSSGNEMIKARNFNPHNQYLSIALNYGVVAMIVFLVCIIIIFRKVFKIPEGLYFGIALLLFFLSESMLERQMGVYYFGLIAIFLYNVQLAGDGNTNHLS